MEWEGLLPLTTYQFRVAASNRLGTGPWSSIVNVTTGLPAPPEAPSEIFLDNVTEALIAVQWPHAVSKGVPVLSYELERDDWWLTKDFYNTYKGPNRSFIETSALLPASTYTFRARALNVAGPGPYSDPVNFTTNGKGGCGNAEDMKVFFDTKTTMKAAIQSAIIGCLTKPRECVVDDIHTNVGLSIPCAQCWAEEASCTLANCWAPCLAPKSQACADCSQRECFPACVVCSGVPTWAYPP